LSSPGPPVVAAAPAGEQTRAVPSEETPHLPQPTSPDAVLSHIGRGTAVVAPLANGEPMRVLDSLEAHASRLEGVTVHQMHALHDRPYLHGAYRGRLDHVSYFLSEVTRPAFHAGTIDLVPSHFSEVPTVLARRPGPKLVVAACSPPDRHGYVSLGTNADYVASFIGRVPFFLEANEQMPRTFGRNQIHLRQAVGWTQVDYPLVEVKPLLPDDVDVRIAKTVAERVPDGATLQIGIGRIPDAILSYLTGHRDLGVHTELLSDGMIELVERGVVTGARKRRRPGKVVTTFCLGTRRLYDFLDENPVVELLPVDWVNDPRVIATEPTFVSINATTEVDLLGQCASETIEGRYWSGSGGQADFARGAMFAEDGHGYIVLRSMTHSGRSRIVSRLAPGSVVTTVKNTVDHIVTEHGIASLRGRTIGQRAQALISIADPSVREQLERDARELGFLRE
jgi:acyl-CoA hydrolase